MSKQKTSHDESAQRSALQRVELARDAREAAELAEQEAIGQAREAGVTWGRIGEVYGLTKQGAQQRFKPRKP